LTEQLAPSLDVLNKTSRKEADADWIHITALAPTSTAFQ